MKNEEIRPLLADEVPKVKAPENIMSKEQWEAEVRKVMPGIIDRLAKAAKEGKVLRLNQEMLTGVYRIEAVIAMEGKKDG